MFELFFIIQEAFFTAIVHTCSLLLLLLLFSLYSNLFLFIFNREEGIILKAVDGTWVPNERRLQWIKLKPEYVDGLGDDLDLLIVGGYYGKGVGRYLV